MNKDHTVWLSCPRVVQSGVSDFSVKNNPEILSETFIICSFTNFWHNQGSISTKFMKFSDSETRKICQKDSEKLNLTPWATSVFSLLLWHHYFNLEFQNKFHIKFDISFIQILLKIFWDLTPSLCDDFFHTCTLSSLTWLLHHAAKPNDALSGTKGIDFYFTKWLQYVCVRVRKNSTQ